jgi:hypothetical protein
MPGSSKSAEPDWDKYAPLGSKRRQTLEFLGVVRASARNGSTASESVAQSPSQSATTSRDTTQSLANYFTPSRKGEMGRASERARSEHAQIGEKDANSAGQVESRKLGDEQKSLFWNAPAFFVPGSRSMSPSISLLSLSQPDVKHLN